MVAIVVVTRAALLIARRASTWTIDEHLGGRSPEIGIWHSRQTTTLQAGLACSGWWRDRDGRTSRRSPPQQRRSHNQRLHQARHGVASERNGRAQCEARSGNFQQPSNEQPEACELRERNRLW